MGRGTRGRARDVRGRKATTPEQHQQPTHLDNDDEPNKAVSILDQEGKSGNESDDFQETLDEQLAFHHSPPRMPGQLGKPFQTTAGIDTTVNTDTGALGVERLSLNSPPSRLQNFFLPHHRFISYWQMTWRRRTRPETQTAQTPCQFKLNSHQSGSHQAIEWTQRLDRMGRETTRSTRNNRSLCHTHRCISRAKCHHQPQRIQQMGGVPMTA